MTVTEFLSRHPEFRDVSTLAAAALENAEQFVDSTAFGTRYDLALEYKACALLASGKYGQLMPAPNTSQQADYQKLFEELRKLNTIRGLVT